MTTSLFTAKIAIRQEVKISSKVFNLILEEILIVRQAELIVSKLRHNTVTGKIDGKSLSVQQSDVNELKTKVCSTT